MFWITGDKHIKKLFLDKLFCHWIVRLTDANSFNREVDKIIHVINTMRYNLQFVIKKMSGNKWKILYVAEYIDNTINIWEIMTVIS